MTLLRGVLYGTAGATLGYAWDPDFGLMEWLLHAVFLFPLVALVAGPFLTAAAMIVQLIQEFYAGRLPRWLLGPLGILTGVPFGTLICFVLFRSFGKAGNPWTDAAWLPLAPAAIAGGLALGFGSLRDLSERI